MNEQLDDLKAFARILNQRVERLEKERAELKHELAVSKENIAWVLKYISEEPLDINAGHIRYILDANQRGEEAYGS